MKTRASLSVCVLLVTATFLLSAPAAAIDRERGVKLGEKAPDFTYPDRYGNLVSLHDYEGKKVILFFWVSWCICRDQLPLLEKFREQNKSGNYEIISVSVDAQGERYVNPIADLAGVKYPVLLDRRADTARLYHYPATPAVFLIDEAGAVKHQYITEFELSKDATRAELESFLNEPPVKSTKPADSNISDLRAALEKQLEQTPDDVNARRKLAGVLMDTGDAKAAVPHWETVVSKNKRSCPDIFSLATAQHLAGDDAGALKNWKSAAKCDPTNYIFYRTVQSFEDPNQFYSKEKMKALYIGPK